MKLRFLPAFLIFAFFTVAFAIQPAHAQTLTTVHSFTGSPDGANPQAGLVRDSKGNFYGTSEYGGANCWVPGGCGTVFKIDASGNESIFYTFTGGADGASPSDTLAIDSQGNLYGTAGGGASGCDENHGCGVVFRLTPAGKFTLLYAFTDTPDGSYPIGGVIRDSKGNLYGTTSAGGTDGLGIVFKLDTTGHETILHSFAGADGAVPITNLLLDSKGNLYGTTHTGGVAFGVVYKIDASGNETVLHTLEDKTDGSFPDAGFIQDSEGNLYSTAAGGGNGYGVVYKMTPAGYQTILYTFTGGADGANPAGNLVRDKSGNLYGTTYGGGTGYGVIFKVTKSGKETPLYAFTGGADGANPFGGVIGDGHGNGYGTTYAGGNTNCVVGSCGTVFEISPK
jgi:uncharacterized repeat protein (TIGR03803 family)